MIFIQQIRIVYQKDVRYANYGHERNHLKFYPVRNLPELNGKEIFVNYISLQQLPGELLFQGEWSCFFTENFFYTGKFQDNWLFSRKNQIAVQKQNQAYQILYTSKEQKSFMKPVFTLEKNQYGRILFNERQATSDSQWYYILYIVNFLNADAEQYREKLFFRKEPDYLFSDRKYLKYSG